MDQMAICRRCHIRTPVERKSANPYCVIGLPCSLALAGLGETVC